MYGFTGRIWRRRAGLRVDRRVVISHRIGTTPLWDTVGRKIEKIIEGFT
jgi:hypothetical protein